MASRVVALTMTSMSYDVLIIGGGAAGLSAGLVLGRARRRVAVVDAGSPRNAPAAHMQVFKQSTPPIRSFLPRMVGSWTGCIELCVRF